MSGESYCSPSSYYTLPTSCFRTKNVAPQFPAHIFQAKQSIDSYENVCKLFTCKTHTSLYCCKGISVEKFEMEKKNWTIYLTLPGHFLNIYLGHGAADHSFKMLSECDRKKTAFPRSNGKYIFSVSRR